MSDEGHATVFDVLQSQRLVFSPGFRQGVRIEGSMAALGPLYWCWESNNGQWPTGEELVA